MCESIESIPLDLLPATKLNDYCYFATFSNCEKLNYIEVAFNNFDQKYTNIWLKNVAITGTLKWNGALTDVFRGEDYAPTGWTIIN